MARVNSLDSGLTKGELEALISPDLSGISIGKSQTVFDLKDVDQIITNLESAAGLPPGQIRMIPWIENARAVLTALELASSSPRIEAIAFGAEDYTDDMADPAHRCRGRAGICARHRSRRRQGSRDWVAGHPIRSIPGRRRPATRPSNQPAYGFHRTLRHSSCPDPGNQRSLWTVPG